MNIKTITLFWNTLVSVFGLSIVSLSVSKNWIISYVKIFWAVLMTLLFGALFYFQTTDNLNNKRIFPKSKVVMFILLSGNLIANLVRFVYLLKTRQLVKLYQKIIRFDEQHFGTNVVAWKSQTFRLLFFCFFVLIGYAVFDSFFVTNSSEIIIGCYIYPAYFVVVFGQMALFLLWIRNILNRIKNDYLLNVEIQSLFFVELRSKKSHRVQLRIIRQARILYHELFMISRLVNEIYATPVLIMLAHNLNLSIIYTYALTYSFRYENDEINVLPVHWALLAYIATFAIIHPFHKTSHEASLLVVDIQGLLIKFDDERLSRELYGFSGQIQQERMEFSPYGLFEINHRIMLGMMGAVATYLVVFTQFNISL